MSDKYNLSDDDTKEKGRKIPSYFLATVLGALMLLAYCVALIDYRLPTPVTIEEAGRTRFSEQRAWGYLEEIVGNGARVAGTWYHRRKTEDLVHLVEDVAADAVQRVHIDWQLVSGDYWLEYQRPFVNMYHNVSNVIVLLEGESGFNPDGTTGSSILFNCHHDTVPMSPGVADDAVFCAVFVEVLLLLSQRNEKFKHNLIFLFNGAEETYLQGAAGFLKHPWSKGVTSLVNLESTGTNCKPMLFQVTDARVVSAYRRSVPRPAAQSLAEVVFSSGIVPSDTDFRIFRDFGPIHGIDVAFSQIGHVYHTRHDSLEILAAGVLQHAGELVFGIAKEMADSDDFHTKDPEITSSVHYDYLNLFMLDYTFTVAHVVDTLMVACAIASVLYYHWMVGFRLTMTRELLLSALGRLLSAAAGISLLWIITGIMVATTTQLRYLANSWIVVPIFWFPYLIGAVGVSQLFDAWRCHKSGLNRVRRMAQAMASTRLILVVISVILLCIPGTPPMRYVLIMPLFLMSVAGFVSITIIMKLRLPAWVHLIVEFLLGVPAQMFLFIIAIKVNTLMLPIMGRSPMLTPDYLAAILNMLLIVISSLPLSGIELLFSRIRIWITFLITVIVCLAVSFSPIFPYNDHKSLPVVQRHSWFHSEIITYDASNTVVDRRSGIWFAHTEVNTPMNVLDYANEAGIQFRNIKTDFTEDCDLYTYCNLALYNPRNIEFANNSLWVDFDPPAPANPAPSLNLLGRNCASNICSLEFSLIGPSHMALIIWPRPNIDLVSWSFESPVNETTHHHGRPVYYVFYSRATYSEVMETVYFSIDFRLPVGHTGPIMDLSLTGNRINHPEEFTASYMSLMAAMPEWFNIATFLSSRYNYIY